MEKNAKTVTESTEKTLKNMSGEDITKFTEDEQQTAFKLVDKLRNELYKCHLCGSCSAHSWNVPLTPSPVYV